MAAARPETTEVVTATPTTDLVVNPATGEALELASEATDRLAQERRAVTHLKRDLNDYLTFIDGELTRRLDRMGRRSAVVAGYTIETKAPTTTEYDQALLRNAIEDLIACDLLDQPVLDEVLVPVDPVPRKLNRTRLNTLLKHPNEKVREVLEACAQDVPQRRSVSIKEPK